MTPTVRRVVYVCPESPRPRTSGGAQRIDSLRRAIAATGAAVHLVVVGERPTAEARRWLREERARVFPSKRDPTRFAWALRCASAALRGRSIPAARYLTPRRADKLARHVRSLSPDLVLLGDVYLADAFLPSLRSVGTPLVADTHDAASVVHARIAGASRDPFTKLAYRILAANTSRAERRTLPLLAELWTVSEDDARFYRDHVKLSRVVSVPNAIDLPTSPASVAPEEPGSVVFVGSYSYWPNEDAALRLVEMSQPLHASGALTRLYLVGTAPTARMRRMASRAPHVVVTGRVPEVGSFLARAAVVAAPLAAGSGVKVKLLEAMAAARPVVTTPIGAEGLALTPGVHAEVASLETFPDVLERLLRDPSRQAALATSGRRWVEERHSARVVEGIVAERLEHLLGRRDRCAGDASR